MKEETKKLSISVKSFVTSMAIIIGLMILAYVLTFILPAGLYERVTENGNQIIKITDENPYGIYAETSRDFPFYKFLLSPVLMLGGEGSLTIIAIIIFLLVIGGVFSCLTNQHIIEYFLDVVVKKYYNKRYVLLFVLPLIFMLLSSFAGCFEEIIPLVPILVALSISLGWDNHMGLLFSVIACGCGYAAGILNPFGTGVAQEVANEVAFSGIWLRIVTFIILYGILVGFTYLYAKKYEKNHPVQESNQENDKFERSPSYDKALKWLGIILGLGILFIVSSTFISALQDFTLYVFALCFLLGGVVSCFVSGMKGKVFAKSFFDGVVSMLPAAVMILFASSIKYILTESNTIDTLLYYLINVAVKLPKGLVILFVYLIVLLMELFVPSGSAKAFLLMPLIVPIGHVIGISTNLIVLAYIFGDGLANSFYPTNPGLLVSLNLANTNFSAYFKRTLPLIIVLFVVTCAILLFGLAVGYC